MKTEFKALVDKVLKKNCTNFGSTFTKKFACSRSYLECGIQHIEPSFSATSETNLRLNLAMIILLVKVASYSDLIVELDWRILKYFKKR